MSEQYLLEMNEIVKSFPGVKALKGVTLKIRPGEIHGLVGENGAGKSTLMKCLMGIYKPDNGTILFNGKEIKNYSVRDAMNYGIAMIQQELSPVYHRSIMSNIFLGNEPKTNLGFIDWNRMKVESLEWLKKVEEDPTREMHELTIAKMRMVEVARALASDAKLLIMDEPTSALTTKEVKQLFTTMRKIKEMGNSIVFITHRLDEIFEVCDQITVFRDGESVGYVKPTEIDQNGLIQLMVGREIKNLYPKTECTKGEVALKVENLSMGHSFKDVSFEVRHGEILGVAGLVGAGRTEVIETIFGLHKKSSGKIFIEGKEVEINSSSDAFDNGMALLTEERRKDGIFPILDIRFNTTVANLKHYIRKSNLINHQAITADTKEYIKKLDVKTPSDKQLIQFLSGGNQQKVLISRLLLTEPKIIFLDEPTRGIDVGAKSEIHRLINDLAHQGISVVMVSSELPEIMGMSDRIMVMHEGKVTGILENKDINQSVIMEYASGIRDDFVPAETERVNA